MEVSVGGCHVTHATSCCHLGGSTGRGKVPGVSPGVSSKHIQWLQTQEEPAKELVWSCGKVKES